MFQAYLFLAFIGGAVLTLIVVSLFVHFLLKGMIKGTKGTRHFINEWMRVWLEERVRKEQAAIRKFYKSLLYFDEWDDSIWKSLPMRAKNRVRQGLAKRLEGEWEIGTILPHIAFERIDGLGLGEFLPEVERVTIMKQLVLGSDGDLSDTGIFDCAAAYWEIMPPDIVDHLVAGGCLWKLVDGKYIDPDDIHDVLLKAFEDGADWTVDAIGAMDPASYDCSVEKMSPVLQAAAEAGNLRALEKYFREEQIPAPLLRTCMVATGVADQVTAARCCILLNDKPNASALKSGMNDPEAVGMLEIFLRSAA